VHLLGQLVVGDLAFEVADQLGQRDRLPDLGDDAKAIALAEAATPTMAACRILGCV
jgi:hypothetical protein